VRTHSAIRQQIKQIISLRLSAGLHMMEVDCLDDIRMSSKHVIII